MTSVRSAVTTILVGAACATGLSACGGDGAKVSDTAFVTDCAKRFDQNPTLKAYGGEALCKCVQNVLKAKGLGGTSVSDQSHKEDARTAGATCTRKALTGK
jgi:hypothetical protein